MNQDRYRELDRFGSSLTEEEVKEGWHYCPDWDAMLIGPSMPEEMKACLCHRAGIPHVVEPKE